MVAPGPAWRSIVPVIVGFYDKPPWAACWPGVTVSGRADGDLHVQRRWRLGQRQEVHRDRRPRRQGLGCAQGGGGGRYRRRPVQGYRRSELEHPDQADVGRGPRDRASSGLSSAFAERIEYRVVFVNKAGTIRRFVEVAASRRSRRHPSISLFLPMQ